MFLVNSRLGLLSAAPAGSGPRGSFTRPGRPFSRSYGAMLPSSLTRGRPSTSVCSTCRPVSVCGTGTVALARGFSRQSGLNPLGRSPDLTIAPQGVADHGICRAVPPTRLDGGCPPLGLPPCVPPSLVTRHRGTGMLTRCPSPTARALGLGPTHPQLTSMAAEPCDVRWEGFAPSTTLLIPAFALVAAPGPLAGTPSPLTTTLPYRPSRSWNPRRRWWA